MAETWLMDRLTDNAFDFLARAIDEFKDHPKYSIIHFYTAVELFLKARLLHEHWSLVVQKNPDRQKFDAGDFVSVTFDEACDRLQKIAQSPVPEPARKNFNIVRTHRNKMVHFFHEANPDRDTELEAIVQEQLRAWHELNQLLTVQWSAIFGPYKEKITGIETKLIGHREYLRAKFDGLSPSIEEEKKKGIEYGICPSCNFEAARVTPVLGDLFESRCRVCRKEQSWFSYTCPECEETSPLRDGGEFVCPECGHKDDESAIADAINEFVATKDNYFDAVVPANCSECEGWHTIVEYKDQYLCIMCFCFTEALHQCQACGEFSNGDMGESAWAGCSQCEGSGSYKDD